MHYSVIFAAIVLITTVSSQAITVRNLDHQRVLAAPRRATFLAGASQYSSTCGWLNDFHTPVCFYCVGDEICDSIRRDDTLELHHVKAGDEGCNNDLRVLTNLAEFGECAPWFQRVGMLIPDNK